MSVSALALAKSFVSGRLDADEFANAFMEVWRYERDASILINDGDELNQCLSTIFCLADIYNSDEDKEEYELDQAQLRSKISDVIDNMQTTS